MAKKKQRFKKQTIISCLKGKTVDQAIQQLEYLSEKLMYGDCKIEITAAKSSGPGPYYMKSYNGKVKCNVLVPVIENEN